MGVAMFLMTQLTATTPLPIVWLWMFIAGLGVGPTFSVFTIVVQNAVPFRQMGVATSNLTFFRQIGGSVALAIVGTVFGSTFLEQVGPQLLSAGVPEQVAAGFGQATSSGAIDFDNLTGVGDLGTVILAAIPEAFRAAVEPFVGNIVAGIHQAFSLAVAQTFWIGVVAAIVAAAAASVMIEHPLRSGNPAPAAAPGAKPGSTPGAGTDRVPTPAAD
jgi:hypothetical protein